MGTWFTQQGKNQHNLINQGYDPATQSLSNKLLANINSTQATSGGVPVATSKPVWARVAPSLKAAQASYQGTPTFPTGPQGGT